MKRFLGSSVTGLCLIFIFFLTLGGRVVSQAPDFPPSPLTPQQITELGLKFSGEDPQEISQSVAELETWFHVLQAKLGGLEGAALGDTLLKLLHQDFLTQYQSEQTRLDQLLKTGNYNCVSSALVYLILGRRLGLTVEAVEVPSHAFCRVLVGSTWVDVETTTAQGWDPGTKKTFHDEFGHVTGYSYVPPGEYTQRRNLDARGLLGLVLQNRCSLLQKQGLFSQAIPLALQRWSFDHSEASLTMLETVYKDAIAVFNNQQNYSEGLSLVSDLISQTGITPSVKKLTLALVTNQCHSWSERQDYTSARELIHVWEEKKVLNPTQVQNLLKTLTENELVTQLPQLTVEQAQERITQALKAGLINDSQSNQFLTWIYSKAIEKLAQEKGYAASVTYIQNLSPALQQLPGLQELHHQLTQAWSASIHNEFAHLWNTGQHEKARQVLKEGLRVLPDSPLLQQDLNRLPQD